VNSRAGRRRLAVALAAFLLAATAARAATVDPSGDPAPAPAAPAPADPPAPPDPPAGAATADPGATPVAQTESVTVSAETERVAADPTVFATVIRAEDYADRLTTLPELLRGALGVSVKSLGGEFATVSIRGSSAEQVVVYLDGVPLNRALGGGVNIADIPLVQLDSIDIYRGATPASLSMASIGGAIVLHSRAPGPGAHALGSMSLGSFGTAQVAGSYARQEGRGDWLAGVDAATSNGDFTFFDNNGTPFEPSDDSWARRVNNGFTRTHALLRGGLQAGPARVTLNADLLDRHQGVPGVDSWQSTSSNLSTRRALLSAGAEAPGLAGGRLLLRGSLQQTLYEEAFDGQPGDLGLSSRRTDNRMQSTGLESGGTFVMTPHQALSFLGAARLESAELRNPLVHPSDRGTATRQVTTVTIEDQIEIAGGRVLLNPSVRHDHYDSRFAVGPAPGVVPADGAADAATTGRLGVAGRIRDGVTVRANIGRFLRLPDLTELYGDQGSIVGNPGLLPERGTNSDLGFVLETTRPRGRVRQARAEAALFETLADNLILYVPNAQNLVVARNIGQARIHGAEVSLALAAGRFSGTINASRQWAVDASDRYTSGNQLPGRPRDEVSAGAGLDFGRNRVAWDFTYVGPNYTDPENPPDSLLPARYIHDVSWRVLLPRHLEATFQVHNLFDDHAVDVARFPLPGRAFEGRLQWSF
jgi:iron complex outermembrane receptor protein